MISAVIVNYNAERYLERCLDSLQRHGNLISKIVVVDNASSDDSVSLVRRRFPQVDLLPQVKNLGFGRGLNLGAAHTDSKYLLLMNADAWVEEGCVEKLAQRLHPSPRSGLAAPQLYYPDGRLQFVWLPRTSVTAEALQKLRNRFVLHRWNHDRRLKALLRWAGETVFCAACLMVRRTAFDEIGGFDPAIFLYFEDVDFCLRLRQAGWTLEYVPEASAVHVSGGSKQNGWEEQYRRGQRNYYRKYRPEWENEVLRLLLLRKYRRLSRSRPMLKPVVRFLEEDWKAS